MTEFVFIIVMAFGSYEECERVRAEYDLLEYTHECYMQESAHHAPHTSIRPKARPNG